MANPNKWKYQWRACKPHGDLGIGCSFCVRTGENISGDRKIATIKECVQAVAKKKAELAAAAAEGEG